MGDSTLMDKFCAGFNLASVRHPEQRIECKGCMMGLLEDHDRNGQEQFECCARQDRQEGTRARLHCVEM